MRWILSAVWLLLALLYTVPWWLPYVAPVSAGIDVSVGPPEPFRLADLLPWGAVLAPPAALATVTLAWWRRGRARRRLGRPPSRGPGVPP